MADKKSKKNKNQQNNTIAVNRQATHEYFIEERFEAGIVLQGWEVKSLRDGRVQLKESYVVLKRGEAWLSGAHISALLSASTHVKPEAVRAKKLLLHRHELSKLIGSVERKGYTLIPLSMYWKNGRAKLEIGLAKGKQLHDKRATSKDRDWQREKARIMKHA
ncbi:MAG: SsrA-binding protein SmpB [Methylobacter sp.]|nr:SsrA-binding protein SmpB [Methylobacter sp.]